MQGTLSGWLSPTQSATPESVTEPTARKMIKIELLIVFTVTLGLSGVRSLLSLLDALLRSTPLAKQTVALNAPQARHAWIDLGFQLASTAQLVAWGALGAYLLWQNGFPLRTVGLDRSRIGRDIRLGLGLAAAIGLPGLGFYLLTRALGANLTVLPSTLDDTWWRIPALTLNAVSNAWAEEVLVVGYLLTRLRQLGMRPNTSLLTSAVLRGSYHLYQGFGGFVGNVIMGLVFGRAWQRTNRLWALVVAHATIDLVAFVGYAALRGHVSWLP